jgi:CTP:phosphocholine cytidylyltransferase-like protein
MAPGMTTIFRQLIFNIPVPTMEVQKELLMERLLDWKGKNDQFDDILVIGIKV